MEGGVGYTEGGGKAVEAVNTELNGFDWAIKVLKNGHAVRRSGWNGKGMCIFLNKGAAYFPDNCPIPALIDGIKRAHFESWSPGITTRLPNINMRSVSGATVTGWVASQSDMLAEDWQFA